MKRNLLILLSLSLVFAFTSCEKELDSEGVSKVTYFPIFEMTGAPVVFSQLGVAYTDPGIVATENGVSIPVTLAVKGIYKSYSGTTVNTDIANKYDIVYSAVNSDGFIATQARSVWVFNTGDFSTSIEGLYTAKVIRTPSQGAVPATRVLSYILIWKNADNSYGISDGIGGYYDLGRSYGPGYAASGCNFNYNLATSTFTAGADFGVGAFGGVASVLSMTVNPVDKTINFVTTWDSGYNFNVTLTQVQP